MAEEKQWKPRPKYMGYVTTWNEEREFGFIRNYDDGKTYFCHANSIKNDERLVRQSIVEFEILQDKNDPNRYFAYNVLVVEVPDEYSYNIKKPRKKRRNRDKN